MMFAARLETIIGFFLWHRLKNQYGTGNNSCHGKHKTHDRALQQIDSLFQTDGNHSHERGDERSDHDGNKDIGGILSP